MKRTEIKLAVLGAGVSGCCCALALANAGVRVTLYDKASLPFQGASLHNEGKLHLGYVYAADPSRNTYKVTSQGSMAFLDIIENLTKIPKYTFAVSKPFVYGVPTDSQLTLANIEEYFGLVDDWLANFEYTDVYSNILAPKRAQKLTNDEASQYFDLSKVLGAIRTSEISLDTFQVANIISAAIRSHPNIEFRPNSTVEGAHQTPNGGFQISVGDNCGAEGITYQGVINCLWEDRVRIDRSVGLHSNRPWITRYKATVRLHRPRLSFREMIPSTTLIVGSYGDIVNYNNGQFYFSWYPKCRIGQVTNDDFSSLNQAVEQIDERELLVSSVEEISKFVTPVKQLLPTTKRGGGFKVGGGFIFAWGQTDIDDLESELHSRDKIGFSEHSNWISINTGKYCTGPMFAVAAAKALLQQLNVV